MCVTVNIDGRAIWKYGDLCDALAPIVPIVGGDGDEYDPLGRHDCLCPVNLEATAEAAGYEIVDDWARDEYRFVRPTPTGRAEP